MDNGIGAGAELSPQRASDASVEEPSNERVGQRVASGAAWMILSRIVIRMVGLGSTLALVRLLSPDDFGIVAMAGLASAMLEGLSGFSFDLALVQVREVDRSQFDTVWTLNVLRGAVIAVLTAVSAPLMATWMAEPRITAVIYVVALVPLMQGFENVTLISWQRDLRFDRVFLANACAKILGLSLVIPAAVLLGNYWALVITHVATTFFMVPLGFYLLPYWPRFTISAWRPLFHFSKWLVAMNMLSVIEGYCGLILISRLFGSATLGLYQISSEIGHLPGSEIAAPIRRPMYAGYAKVAHDPHALREQVLDGFGIVLMLLVPSSVGLAVVADSASSLCLGPKWAGAAPLIAILALGALFENLRFFAHHLYLIKNAQGRFAGTMAGAQLVRIILVISLGIAHGVVGAALAILVSAILTCVVLFAGLLSLLRLSWRDLLRVAWRTVVAAAGMAAVVRFIAEIWPMPIGLPLLALQTGTLCLAGIITFGALQLLLWHASGYDLGPERQTVEWLKPLFRNASLWARPGPHRKLVS